MTKTEMAPFSLRLVNRQWLVSGVVAKGHQCLLGDDVTEERGCSSQAPIPAIHTVCQQLRYTRGRSAEEIGLHWHLLNSG